MGRQRSAPGPGWGGSATLPRRGWLIGAVSAVCGAHPCSRRTGGHLGGGAERSWVVGRDQSGSLPVSEWSGDGYSGGYCVGIAHPSRTTSDRRCSDGPVQGADRPGHTRRWGRKPGGAVDAGAPGRRRPPTRLRSGRPAVAGRTRRRRSRCVYGRSQAWSGRSHRRREPDRQAGHGCPMGRTDHHRPTAR